MADRHKFHKAVYRCLIPLGSAYAKLFFNYTYEPAPELPENYIALSNHTTNFDMVFVAAALKKHMYFVGSEHIMSAGVWSKLLRLFLDPIPRPKGGSAVTTVRRILRQVKDGHSICIFAEGNCSWDGENSPILDSTGKLCRSSRASLVTFRLEGGYFTHPRWAYSTRRGRLHGRVVNIYSPEQLREMSAAEINSVIRADLHENAYERQLESPVRYRGRRLSRGIEHTLIMCPGCGRIDSITSTDEGFSCPCGLHGRYDEFGMLSGEGFDFKTVLDWHSWQKSAIDALDDAEEVEYTHDDKLTLYAVEAHERKAVGTGRVSMTNRRFILPGLELAHSDISDLAVRLRGTVSFTAGSTYYELKGDSPYNGHKYELLHAHFAAKPAEV